MAEYIKRDAALRDWPLCDEPADAYQYIRSYPAADVRPVVRGRWMHKEITPDFHAVGQCSVCKERRRIDNYCPNCGANMREAHDGI